MIGKTYLERGKPVIVLVRWGKGGGPRNVLIQRTDGTKVVRPFRGLRKLATLLFLLSSAALQAQTIATRTMTPGAAIPIALSPQVTTTLLLPAIPSGTFGLGLITANNSNAGGLIQIDHPDGSPIIVLHPLSETAAVTMTVLLEGQLFVFDLRSA